MATRYVVLDDNDPSILYTGTWGHDQGISGIADAFDEKLMGPAYNNTSTFTGSDSSISFTFTGTEITVHGGVNFQPTGTYGSCFIDGKSTDNMTELMVNSGIAGTNGNLLCFDTGLPDGTHTLTMNLTGMENYAPLPGAHGAANRVWVDQIIYVPTPDAGLDNVSAILVWPGDSQLNYSSGWQTYAIDGKSQLTRQAGSSVTFIFNGTSVDYYGTILNDDQANISSTASYTIDGSAPVTVPLVDFDSGSTPNNTPLFQSGTLPSGQHNLTVTYNGQNSSVVALALVNLIYQPSVIDLSTNTGTPSAVPLPTTTTSTGIISSAGSTPTASPTNTGLPLSSHKTKTVVAAGIAIGVALVVCCLLCLLFLHRRYRGKRKPRIIADALPESKFPAPMPSTAIPVPFLLTSMNSNSTSDMSQNQPTDSPTIVMRKQRHVQERSQGPSQTSNVRSPPIPSPSSSKNPETSRRPSLGDIVVMHDDSGVRVRQPSETNISTPARRVVELPPSYTP